MVGMFLFIPKTIFPPYLNLLDKQRYSLLNIVIYIE